MRARIALVSSAPREFSAHIERAKQCVRQLLECGASDAKIESRITWFDAIRDTTTRQYGSALAKCRAMTVSKQSNHDDVIKCRLRVAQTLMTLARLKEATTELDGIEEAIEAADSPKPGQHTHHRAMLVRHRSTVATVRLLLWGHAPSSSDVRVRQVLYEEGKRNAEQCFSLNDSLKMYQDRRARPDETGMGIARLKAAQAAYADAHYGAAVKFAEEAIRYVAPYANSRWWRICCHDVLARALAKSREFDSAETELAKAEQIWADSTKEDELRWCELLCTRGIIEQERGKLVAAVDLFRKSLKFESDAICTRAYHMHHLLGALTLSGAYQEAGQLLMESGTIGVDW
jgi:tetratricopeptide (TPR) repeat protein